MCSRIDGKDIFNIPSTRGPRIDSHHRKMPRLVFFLSIHLCLISMVSIPVLYAQELPLHALPKSTQRTQADTWADSLLSRLSPREQLAQLMLMPAHQFQSSSSKKYLIGGLFLQVGDPLPVKKDPSLKIPYWLGRAFSLQMPRQKLQPCLGETLLEAIEDTVFLGRSAQQEAKRLQQEGIHFFTAPKPCRSHTSIKLEHYKRTMQDRGLIGPLTLQTDPQRFTLDKTLPLFLSHSITEDLNVLYKRLIDNDLDKDTLRNACRRILHAKYRTFYTSSPRTQSASSTYSRSFQERLFFEKALTVLHNKADILPIQQLESLQAAILNLGEGMETPFAERVQDYLEMPVYRLSEGSICEKLKEVDVVLLTLYHPRETLLSMSTDRWNCLLDLLKHKQVVLCLFGNAEVLDAYSVLNQSSAIICAYTAHRHAQDYTAQLLFGGIGASGRIPYALANYKKGSGQNICCPSRLKFTVPEELGIAEDSLHRRINTVIEEALTAQAFPGCQILLAKDGKVFFYETYGFHTYQKKKAVQRSDLYDLASITKVMGPTTALMRLYEQDRFVLDAPLSKYLSVLRRSDKASLSFREVLAHYAGLKAWIPYYKTVYKKNGKYKRRTLSKKRSRRYPIALNTTLFLHRNYKKKIYKMIKKSPLHEEKKYVYSDLSFYLMPILIKKQAGMSYTRYLSETFYQPLGAHTLVFNPEKQLSLTRIVPTEIDTFFRKRLLHGLVHDEGAAMMGGISGHAGLFGKGVDVAKLWQMYLQGGSYGKRTFLSPETLATFTSCQFCEAGNRRGLGFDKPPIHYVSGKSPVAPQASPQSFGHSGFTGTLVWADPAYQFLYVFLSNRVYPSREHRAIYSLDIRPRIHKIVYELLENK